MAFPVIYGTDSGWRMVAESSGCLPSPVAAVAVQQYEAHPCSTPRGHLQDNDRGENGFVKDVLDGRMEKVQSHVLDVKPREIHFRILGTQSANNGTS